MSVESQIRSLMRQYGWTQWPLMKERRVDITNTTPVTIQTPFFALALDFTSWLENQNDPTTTYTLIGGGTAATFERLNCRVSIFTNSAGHPSVSLFNQDIHVIKNQAEFKCTTAGINHYTSLRIIDLTP